MSEKRRIGDFEQRLLDHVEMLYGVALKLTHNPWDAERITRVTMLQAWHWRNERNDKRSLKAELLKLLRHTFVGHCQVIRLRGALWASQWSPSKDVAGSKAGVPGRERPPAKQIELVAAL